MNTASTPTSPYCKDHAIPNDVRTLEKELTRRVPALGSGQLAIRRITFTPKSSTKGTIKVVLNHRRIHVRASQGPYLAFRGTFRDLRSASLSLLGYLAADPSTGA